MDDVGQIESAESLNPDNRVPIKTNRKCKLDWLKGTAEGKLLYNKFILSIELRVSAHVAAVQMGISVSTFQRWIKQGNEDLAVNEDSQTIHAEFVRDVNIALGNAVTTAQIELHAKKPEQFLARGMGRALVGDMYNHDGGGRLDYKYNMDGTVQEDKPAIESDDSGDDVKGIDRELALAALKDLRDNGHDLNALVDALVSDKRIESENGKVSE